MVCNWLVFWEWTQLILLKKLSLLCFGGKLIVPFMGTPWHSAPSLHKLQVQAYKQIVSVENQEGNWRCSKICHGAWNQLWWIWELWVSHEHRGRKPEYGEKWWSVDRKCDPRDVWLLKRPGGQQTWLLIMFQSVLLSFRGEPFLRSGRFPSDLIIISDSLVMLLKLIWLENCCFLWQGSEMFTIWKFSEKNFLFWELSWWTACVRS